MPDRSCTSSPWTRRRFLKAAALLPVASASSRLLSADDEDRRQSPAGSPRTKLHFHTESPNNAEPALDDLVESWLTPVEHFYIRSHAPVPEIDVRQYKLSIEGLVDQPLTLTLAEFELSESATVATLTCAGNRRSEHSEVRQVEGVPWGPGAIGNARWGGVWLWNLLKTAGVKENARHVWFEGLDEIKRPGGAIPFGGSIPIEKAMGDAGSAGALVATTMNEQPLSPDHGFPVRMVVPGYIGARSVKWLGKIVVSDRPSPNHYLQKAYKLVARDKPLEWAEAGPIYRFPLNAAICSPTAGHQVKPGTVQVAGYALPPGEAGVVIERVEISADAGDTWTTAKFKGAKREFCWQLWSAEIPIDAATQRLTVRAIDSQGNVQPRHVPWNIKGYLFHGWHDVAIDVEA